MEILINREKDLSFSWNPGCVFVNGDYVTSPIGKKGPIMKEEDLGERWSQFNIPKSVQFHIGFKNKDDVNLYKDILELVNGMKNFDQIRVIKNEPRQIREKVCLKNDWRNHFGKINKQNDKRRKKYNTLVSKMEQLGCRQFDYPEYEQIPNEWFEWKEYVDTTWASISVCCHSDTQFYKFLQRNNIFEKYFPEWYQNGQF